MQGRASSKARLAAFAVIALAGAAVWWMVGVRQSPTPTTGQASSVDPPSAPVGAVSDAADSSGTAAAPIVGASPQVALPRGPEQRMRDRAVVRGASALCEEGPIGPVQLVLAGGVEGLARTHGIPVRDAEWLVAVTTLGTQDCEGAVASSPGERAQALQRLRDDIAAGDTDAARAYLVCHLSAHMDGACMPVRQLRDLDRANRDARAALGVLAESGTASDAFWPALYLEHGIGMRRDEAQAREFWCLWSQGGGRRSHPSLAARGCP